MIQFDRLRKEYDEVVAARDLSFSIPEGEIFGLIGPNGAGKTTLIRMACGLLPPTSGRVIVNGVDVHSEPERAQAFIGYLSDFFNLYDDLKVWEYLDYFAHAYKMPDAAIAPRIRDVIAQVGLEVKHDALIKGLSRGMKQRLGIGRAVVHRPKVLLLDEPASGLDPKARLELKQMLKALRDAGTTVVVSSHILPDLEDFCTSIGVMERGQMLRQGRIEAIAAQAAPQRIVAVDWLSSGADPAAALAAVPGVSITKPQIGHTEFAFSGDNAALARTLAALVQAGVLVTQFGEIKQTVEELYLNISHNEVM